MLFDEKMFLKQIYELTLEAISERRVFIDEFVTTSDPPHHPLQKMRVLLFARLKGKKGLSPDTDKKIREAARIMAGGGKWKEVDELFGDSFRKDLSKGRRYHARYLEWSSVFNFIDEHKGQKTD